MRALRPWEGGQYALHGLIAAQAPARLVDAETMRAAFDQVTRGEDLPRLGLTHIGVRVAIEFEADDWATVLPAIRAVADGQAELQYGYAVDAARRILAAYEIAQLDEGPVRGFLRGAIDPSAPPLAPGLLRMVLDELGLTADQIETTLPRAPTAALYVQPLLDGLRA